MTHLDLTNLTKFASLDGRYVCGHPRQPHATAAQKSSPSPRTIMFAPAKDFSLTPRTVAGSLPAEIIWEMEHILIMNSGRIFNFFLSFFWRLVCVFFLLPDQVLWQNSSFKKIQTNFQQRKIHFLIVYRHNLITDTMIVCQSCRMFVCFFVWNLAYLGNFYRISLFFIRSL